MSSYVFIDARVLDIESLLASLAPDAVVSILDPAQDGLAKMTQALEGVTNLDAIHIISHGSEGALYLGDTVLTSDNLDHYLSELATIGSSLTNDGDILLYGCDVANGVGGQSFIKDLVLYTSADVAASDDPTGASFLGGDTELEVAIGDVSTSVLISQEEFDNLSLVLAAPPVSITPGTGSWIWTNQFGDVTRPDSISASGQIDYVRFVANASGNHTFSVSGAVDSQLRIYNSSGTAISGVIDDPVNPGATESVTLSLIDGNWYYVAVSGFSTSTGTYSLSINGPSPFINVIDTPGTDYTGSFTGGNISPAGEVDWFRVVAPSGTSTLRIDVDAVSLALNTNVEVRNSDGSFLHIFNTAGAGGTDTKSISVSPGATYYVGVTSLESGTYDVYADFDPNQQLPVLSIAAASANKAEGNSGTTPFTFTVTRTGNTSISTSANWTIGAISSPAADSSDFSGLTTGIVSWVIGDTSAKTITLNVIGDTLYEGGGLPENFTVNLSNAIGATIGASSFASGYIQNDDADSSLDPNDQISEAQALGAMTNDRAVTGTIDVGSDVDMFSFTVTAGQRIAFDLDRPSGSLDSYLRLFNSSGTELAFNNNGSAPNELFSTTDSWLEHTFSAGGTYYVGVSNSGNTSYSAATGTGDGTGSTGAYNLYASVTGGFGFAGISGQVSNGTDTFNVFINRDDLLGAAISPTQRTWIVIHGRNSSSNDGNIQAVADAIHQQLPGDQLLTLDWSSAAADIGYTHEDWIPFVGAWARDALVNHGFLGSTINLIGHSWGSYVAAQLAEGMSGGVNTIVALDPAENSPTASWNPNDPGEIDFDRDSTFSWAFYSRDGGPFGGGVAGNEETPITANEAIVVTNSDHGPIVFLFAYMEDPDTGTGSVSQIFQLQRLLDHTLGPWIPNQYDYSGNPASGGYEAVIIAASGGQSPQSITYVPNTPVAGSLSISDVTMSEGNSGSTIANFTVTRTGGSAAFAVNYASANGTATAGSDYVAASNTLNFGVGVNSQPISVTINGDITVEPDETFFVNLSGATNGAIINDSQGQFTILNDDSVVGAGLVSIGHVTISEGDSGTKVLNFTVTRTGATAAFAVNYATIDISANAGSDYVATSNTLNFGVSVNTLTIPVTINGDTVVEPDETFYINLSGATNGAVIFNGQGQGTIINDDIAAPVFSIGNAGNVTEGNNAVFMVSYTGTLTVATTVYYTTIADTALSSQGDYQIAVESPLTFNPGGPQSQAISIPTFVEAGNPPESDETFSVNLQYNTGLLAVLIGNGTATISANGGAQAPAGTDKSVTLLEDGSYTFAAADFGFSDPNDNPPNTLSAVKIATLPGAGTLKLSGVSVSVGQTIVVASIPNLSFTPLSNGNGANYANFTFQVQDNGGTFNGGVDLDPTPNTITLNVTAVNDASVNAVPGARSGTEDTDVVFTGASAITVADVDNATLTTTLSIASGTLTLGGTAGVTVSGNATGTVQLTGAVGAINTALNGTSFNPTADYTGAATLTVSTTDGAITDIDTVGITLAAIADIANDTVSTYLNTVVTISVLGNDSFENAGRTITAVNGSAITAGGAALVVTNGTVGLNVSGQLIFTPAANFSGVVPAFTYTVTSGGVTETANVNVTVNATPVPEIAVFGSAQNIVDGDSSPAFLDGTDFGSATQGGVVIDRVFTVSNTGNVALTTSGLTLPTGFSLVEGLSATIAANNSDTFTVRLDTVVAGTKNGQITFNNNDTDESLFNFSITGTVNVTPVGSLSISDVTMSEGNSGSTIANFTVTRTGGSAAFAVNYASANGTATAGSDYVAASNTLNFGVGVNSQPISVTINGDTTVEPDETFFVNLSGATNGAIISDSQGQGTIINDENNPTVSVADTSVAEGGVLRFRIFIEGGQPASQDIDVSYTTQNGTAEVDDFVPVSGTITIFTGQSEVFVNVSTIDDYSQLIAGFDDILELHISSGLNAIIGDGIATGEILDDGDIHWQGDSGNNVFNGRSGPGEDIYDGDIGIDTVNYATTTTGIIIDLAGGSFPMGTGLEIGNDFFVGIENIIGGSGGDSISGDNTANDLAGNGGNDILTGSAGNDMLDGGIGTDTAAYNGLRSQYTVALQLDGSIQVFDLRNGSPDGTDSVRNVELFQFSDRVYNPANNHAPVVGAPSNGVAQNTLVAASTLFSVTDADGDAIVQYRFWDSAGGGRITVSGVTQAEQQNITVNAANFATVNYVGAAAVGSEVEWVQVFDGFEWSAWQSWNMATLRGTNTLPAINAPNRTVLQNQWVEASNLFSESDGDGDSMTQYQFIDNTATAGSGYIWVNGATPTAGTTITVTAANLATVWMRGGVNTGVDGLQVRANDGFGWSNWANFNLTTRLPNNSPVVTAPNASVRPNQSVIAPALFSTSDADADPITQYQFWDSVGAGRITVNGVAQIEEQSITVMAANLNTVSYRGGPIAGSEIEYVRAFDGTDWSVWKNWTMATVNRTPVVAPVSANRAIHAGQSVVASTLFNVTDADNDAITQYQFWDSAGMGRITVSNVPQTEQQNITVSAANLGTVSYVGGASTGSETEWVRAFDGFEWSVWQSWTMATGNNVPVATPLSATRTVHAGQSVVASTLFSTTDADNDIITLYQFWDSAGVGRVTVNGVPQTEQQNITVSAANLGTVSYVGGASTGSETEWVRAFDGFEWSVWQSWTMTTGNNAPVAIAADNGVATNATVLMSNLFSVTDVNGDPITQYQFWDSAGVGRVTVNGVPQTEQQNITVSTANLGTVSYVGGPTPASETEWVRVFDGVDWSAWQSWTMQSVSDAAGNTNGTARAVPLPLNAITQSFTDWVGNGDGADIYSFNLPSASPVHLNLTGTSAPVNIAIRDAGNNAVFSTAVGSTPASLNTGALSAGTYFASITPTLPNSTFYTLALSSV